ncbi:hypothetical protein [Microlunatus speluncae]|uniref:hypothetical protein n=1 Tax=Microlunatus speluncae TaxID=2594267 RepID=UPI0012667B7C|nr:hypothetical protein [Microlunatus speluncae]
MRLPPDRSLPDKQARVDRILDETTPTDLAARRRRRLSYALAAAVALIVGALGVGALIRTGGPEVSGDPPATVAPTPPVTSRPPGSTPSRTITSDPSALPVGGTAELEFFTFTLLDTRQTSAGFAAEIRTCLTGTPPGYERDSIPIGWYAWRAVTERNTYQANVEDLTDPAFTPVYPSGTRFEVGECVEGWLPFEAIGAAERVTELTYSNDYGGEARWQVE